MRLDRFDLNLLIVFEAVFIHKNLTRASEHLHLAQPTVSNALTRLRDAFNDPLFVRDGHGVSPTPLARETIGPVRQALAQIQGVMDGSIEFDPGTTDRVFRISITEAQETWLLPSLVNSLALAAPKAKLNAFQVDRRQIKDALAFGQIDVAIDISNLSSQALNRTALATSDYVCAFRHGHPIQQGRLTMKRFLAQDLIAVSSRQSGSSLLEFSLRREGIQVEPRIRTQHYLSAFSILYSTDYVTIAPAKLAHQFGLVTKKLPFEVDTGGIWMFWHRSTEDDQANRWFRELIYR